jgi:hypothetical protein
MQDYVSLQKLVEDPGRAVYDTTACLYFSENKHQPERCISYFADVFGLSAEEREQVLKGQQPERLKTYPGIRKLEQLSAGMILNRILGAFTDFMEGKNEILDEDIQKAQNKRRKMGL